MKSLSWVVLTGLLLFASGRPLGAQAELASDQQLTAVRNTLLRLAAERWQSYAAGLSFTRFGREANPFRADSGVRVFVLQSSDSGWSAIAVHDRLAGAACGIHFGTVPPPLNPEVRAGTVACSGVATATATEPPAYQGARLFLEAELASDDRPRLIGCQPATTQGAVYGGTVRLRVIVDTMGVVHPVPIRIVESGSFEASKRAILRAAGCLFRPGRVEGRSVVTSMNLTVQMRLP